MLEKQESKWYVHCPVCGGYLIKSSASNSEVECKRCHNTIGVLVNEGCVTVYEKRDDLAEMQGRVAVYQTKYSRRSSKEAATG